MILSMASSSSCSSNIQTRSGPIDGDVLWIQPKHVSEHVWNGEPDKKLHIRRAVPTYQGEEQIPEEIVSLLRQSGFYWIMKMGYLKINATLISALIERWRLETHTFHLRCGEATITLQDVSVLLGLRTDGAPLIGSTNLDWADLCEELLGVKPQEGELEGSVVKLSWLAHHFSHINIDDDNIEQLQRFARAWILRFIGGVLFVNKSSSKVSLRWLRRGNQHIGNDDLRVFRCKLDLMKRHEWHQPDRVLRQCGMQQPIPGCPSQPQNLYGITLKGKQDENWFHLLAPMISQWNNRAEFRVDEGLLGFNSDYMVWYRRKTKMFVDPNNANTTELYMVSPQGRNTMLVDDLVPYVEKLAILCEEQERITKPVSHGPASEREFPAQEFHILQSSVETRGIGRRREPVEAEQYSQQMMERGHGMYYTLATFSQYPSQMYQYPFEGHHTDTSTSEHSYGGVAKTQPHFSWPTMTPSQQHDAPIATPNAPFAPQWNVPEAIPDMGDLLGVDLRQEFSAEAEQAEAGRQHGRRNPDRQARRWDRPYGSTQSISFLILVDFGRPFARIEVGSGISVHASLEGGIAASFPRGHHCAE
ncbi:Serine/threonine-protein phosphatase 7 long form [Glycine soja]